MGKGLGGVRVCVHMWVCVRNYVRACVCVFVCNRAFTDVYQWPNCGKCIAKSFEFALPSSGQTTGNTKLIFSIKYT